jgi:hypothetical protein
MTLNDTLGKWFLLNRVGCPITQLEDLTKNITFSQMPTYKF